MRNLKRVLSLALALVMMLSLMIVGAGAKEVTKKDFTDADEISYTEAVDVMVALEVIAGTDTGAFNPKGTLTREAAAKIVCYMLLGPENAEKLTTNTQIFTDVAAGRWSAGYIAYCANLDILAGTGDGSFNPEGALTGVAFGKMLLIALGYDPAIQKYVGANWATSIATDMIDAGIDVKGTTLSDPLTREQAAQMAYQTLTADMVRYDDRGFTYEGLVVGASAPEAVTWGDDEDYDSSSDGIQQFCEKYFDGLEKAKGTDAFGRPVNEWTLDDESIGKYASKSPAVTFTTEKSADDVAKALKNYKLGGFKVENNTNRTISDTSDDVLVANGAAAASLGVSTETIANAIADETGNGKLVEIYADKKNNITSIVALTYTVETVTSAVERKDGDYTRTNYGLTQSGALVSYTDPDKDDDTTAVAHADLERDDVVVTLALANGKTHIYLTEQLTGVQSSFNAGKETIRVDGKDYTVGTGVIKTQPSTALTFADSDSKFNENSRDEITLYLDLYGNVVKKDAVASKDYAVIDAIRWTENTTDLDSKGSATARLIFADGTTETVTLNEMTYGGYKNKFEKNATASLSSADGTTHKVDVDTDDNKATYAGLIVTYTKANNGKYNVTVQNTQISAANVATGTAASKVVTKGVPALQDSGIAAISAITGNNDTVYIVKSKSGSDNVYNAYTGYQNVPTITMGTGNSAKISYVADTGTVAKYIFIDATAGSNIGDKKSGDIVYIFDETNFRKEGSGSDATYFYMDVALNGEIVDEIEVKATDIFTAVGFYEVDRNDKGVVTGVTDDPTFVASNATADAAKGIMKTDGDSYTYNGSETVYVIDVDAKNAYEGVAESAQEDDVVWVKTQGDSGAKQYAIEKAYVIKGGDPFVTKTAATASSGTVTAVTAGQALTVAGYAVTTNASDNNLEKQLTTWVTAWNANRKNATLWEASVNTGKDGVDFTFTVDGALSSTSGAVSTAIGGLTVTNGTASDGSTITYTGATAATAASGTVSAVDNSNSAANLTIFGVAVEMAAQSGTATGLSDQLTAWLAGWEAAGTLDDNWTAAKNSSNDGIDLTYKTTGALDSATVSAGVGGKTITNGTNATAVTSTP